MLFLSLEIMLSRGSLDQIDAHTFLRLKFDINRPFLRSECFFYLTLADVMEKYTSFYWVKIVCSDLLLLMVRFD